MAPRLLTRDGFNKAVFERDKHRCVVCGSTGKLDAHHLLERRLWPDGGYYLNNGVTLCDTDGGCHYKAESTEFSVEFLREKAGITDVIVPPHLFADDKYDKWGNDLLPNGNRLRGELFWEEPVQKVLGPYLDLYVPHVKGPRTYHLPWSPGATSDDKTLDGVSQFEGMEVVVTVKMDGESSAIYGPDGFVHARSVSPLGSHLSRTRLKALAAILGPEIPQDWRVTGENLTAQHSIAYRNLPNIPWWFFMVFNVWNDRNFCLSWDEVKEWTELLDLATVPVLYRGVWDQKLIRGLAADSYNGDPMEGYVVRPAAGFALRDYRRLVGKYVRRNHVTTSDHWMTEAVTYNAPSKA